MGISLAPDSASSWAGVVVSLLAALATVGAVVVALLSAHRESKRHDVLEARQAMADEERAWLLQSAQARLVRHEFTYPEGPESASDGAIDAKVSVRNLSSEPVHDVEVVLDSPLVVHLYVGYHRPFVDAIPPSSVHQWELDPRYEHNAKGFPRRPTARLRFTDDWGQRWERTHVGKLSKIADFVLPSAD
jgi:hypothetical protein